MKTIKIGEISVDSGLVWVGDPCYVFHTKPPEAIGSNWPDFCKILQENNFKTAMEFYHDSGFLGLGTLVASADGDGVYDVMAEIEDNRRIKKIWIDFK